MGASRCWSQWYSRDRLRVGNDFMNNLERRLNQLRQFNGTLKESHDKDLIYKTTSTKNALKHDTIELVVNQIYDKVTKLFNERRKRFGIEGGGNIVDPIRDYETFDIDDNGNLTFIHKNEVIGLGIIQEGLLSPSRMINKLGGNRLKSMGFTNIKYKDLQPHRDKYEKAKKKVRILNATLNERSRAIESSSMTGAEAIEMIEMTSNDIDTTVKGVEQDTSFIKPDDKDKLLPLIELEGLDKQLRTIRGSVKVAIAKRVELESRIEHEESKLNEIQDPSYSDDHRHMIEDRIKKLRDELNERNEEINILKDEASKQINQIRGSITKFLDKETGTLGERIWALFKEQRITIVSILTAVGMAIGVLTEALLGNPTVSTTINTTGNIGGGDKKAELGSG